MHGCHRMPCKQLGGVQLSGPPPMTKTWQELFNSLPEGRRKAILRRYQELQDEIELQAQSNSEADTKDQTSDSET